MAPIAPKEPYKLLNTQASINAKKIRFELNQIELPIGISETFGMIIHPGAALAVPITNDEKVIILRQYRFAVSRRILEFPAGTLEDGESPLESMKRELAEEAGYQANRWDHLGQMLPCPGYSDEVIHLYLARDLIKLEEKPKGDDDEDLEVLSMTIEEFENCLASRNELLDGKSITAWYQARRLLKT